MKRLQRAAVLIQLAALLREEGSWCGETHMQKAVYLLQDLYDVPTDFEFVLYKHGPFSFDLRDELTSLRADGLFSLSPQPEPYGPKLVPTEYAEKLQQLYPKTLRRYGSQLSAAAKTVGNQGVSDLEKIASAAYITIREMRQKSVVERAKRLHDIKPHISDTDARAALNQVDELIRVHQGANFQLRIDIDRISKGVAG